jgi:hypothetical protein
VFITTDKWMFLLVLSYYRLSFYQLTK